MAKRKDLTGKKFGQLTVLDFSHRDPSGISMWRCVCECNNINVIRAYSLTSGRVKSCGCLNSKSKIKHGKINTKEYYTWNRMKSRCNNTKNKSYKDYGGRGIKVCKEWVNSFEKFLIDMGEAPSPKHSIERRNVNGDYTPDNCLWILSELQANNKRNTKYVTYKNKTQTLSAWAQELNISRSVLYQRLFKYNWSVEKTFNTPKLNCRKGNSLHGKIKRSSDKWQQNGD